MRIIKSLLWTIVAANLIFYPVAVIWPPLAAYLLGMIGRMPECAFAQGAAGIGKHVEENRIMDRFSRVSRLIRTESDLELWDTPRGQWWLPVHTESGVLPETSSHNKRLISTARDRLRYIQGIRFSTVERMWVSLRGRLSSWGPSR